MNLQSNFESSPNIALDSFGQGSALTDLPKYYRDTDTHTFLERKTL